jgi:hypothetical protein
LAGDGIEWNASVRTSDFSQYLRFVAPTKIWIKKIFGGAILKYKKKQTKSRFETVSIKTN